MSRAARLLGAHWYLPAFLAMVAAVWLLARTPAFMNEGGEAALLLDLCVTAPALYLLCYGRRQPARVVAIRMLGIACAGVWIGSWLIPASEQAFLPQLAPVRWAGLILLGLVECVALVAVLRIAFSGKGTAEDISAASGAPPWVARLMLWEANFWRAAWRFLRGPGPRP